MISCIGSEGYYVLCNTLYLYMDKFNRCVFVCCRALMDSLITPLELKIEEWKKVASQLDKDHAKGISHFPCYVIHQVEYFCGRD